MKLLAIGDIVGKPGRRAYHALFPSLVRAHQVDFAIVNCENSAAGFGVTPEIAAELLARGAACLTSGNHIWKHRTIQPYIDQEPRLLRPANFPEGAPGKGWGVYSSGQELVAVCNLMGRAGLDSLDCPFRTFDALYPEMHSVTSIIVVDFHAESTAEKIAFAYHVEGRASLVFGTHTHVQTADERILAGGTGFITDIGMTGPEDTVIGVEKSLVVERFLQRMPVRFEVPDHPARLCGILVDVDESTGRTVSIRRIQELAS